MWISSKKYEDLIDLLKFLKKRLDYIEHQIRNIKCYISDSRTYDYRKIVENNINLNDEEVKIFKKVLSRYIKTL